MKDRAPSYKVVDTDYGTMYGTYRPAEADTYYWRFAHFLFPFYTLIPTGILGVQIVMRAWVPLDDEHTMFWSMEAPGTRMRVGSGSVKVPQNGAAFAGAGGRVEYLPNTTDWLGRWRLANNASNDHGIDREAQHAEFYRYRRHPLTGSGHYRAWGRSLIAPSSTWAPAMPW